MTSGQWIAWSVPVGLLIFVGWELLQLHRRRRGNQSALTKSQYVTRQAKAGHRGWAWYILIFPVFIALVGVWLVFHFQAPCLWFNLLCDLSVPWLDI